MPFYPKLTKTTWKVLISLTKRDQTPKELSTSLNMPLGRISEAMSELNKTNILKPRKGYEIIKLDRSFKNVLNEFLVDYSKDKLVDLFFGARLNILLNISDGYQSIASLKTITNYSNPTLKRIISLLQSSLLIYQSKKGVYNIRDVFQNKIKLFESCFSSYFLDSLRTQGIEVTDYKKFGDIIVLKSTQNKILGFSKTGFSLFSSNKLPIFETDEDYFVNLLRPPTKEEIFAHTLIFSLIHQRDTILCILFAEINKLKLVKMKRLLTIYKVLREAHAIFEFLKTQGKIREMEFLPSYVDYLEIRENYVKE